MKNLFVLATILLFTSCNFTRDKGFTTLNLSQFDLKAISYNEVRDYVLVPKCLSCHGEGDEVDLSSYAKVKSQINDIVSSVQNNSMPKEPNSPLSMEQKILLLEWVKLGSPEGKPILQEELTPTFASIKKNIFETKCLSCHSLGNEAAKVPMSTLDELLNSPRELLIPGNAEESGLLISVLRDDDKRMPPPEVGSKLSEHEIKIITEWINKGIME